MENEIENDIIINLDQICNKMKSQGSIIQDLETT